MHYCCLFCSNSPCFVYPFLLWDVVLEFINLNPCLLRYELLPVFCPVAPPVPTWGLNS